MNNIPECVKCGYCCTKCACAFGKYDIKKKKCTYLTDKNICAKYDEIIKIPSSYINPAFGEGCCMSLFNTVREEKIRQISKQERSL